MSAENRASILDRAKQIICRERNNEYGEPEYSFSQIAEYWAAYIKHNCAAPGANIAIAARDVALLMALFKVGRLETSSFDSYDSFIDLIGYSACAADIEFPCTAMPSEDKTE